jgi:transcriptional regulator with XRE-family HTH domain
MFSYRLKELRKKKGLTQEQLAKVLGVERSSIGKYEGKAGVIPSPGVLQDIAAYFGVTVDYLLGREEQKKDPATEYSDEVKKIYELLSQLNLENQEKLLELAIMYVENQNKNKGKK